MHWNQQQCQHLQNAEVGCHAEDGDATDVCVPSRL